MSFHFRINSKFQDKICILVTHQLQYLADVNDIVLLSAGSVAIHGSMKQLKNSDYKTFLWMAGNGETAEQQVEQTNEMELAEVTAEVEKKQRIQQEKQRILREDQMTGAIGYNVFKVYFASVESRCLIICTLATLTVEQFATSFVDFFVSKW